MLMRRGIQPGAGRPGAGLRTQWPTSGLVVSFIER